MIEVSKEPFAVIKHYQVRVTTYTVYDVSLIHNETTGSIEMTADGMSVNSYRDCVENVISIFKKQMGLDESGKKVG